MAIVRTGEDPSCSNYYLESHECKKCLLLGYNFVCGSKECKEALEKDKDRKPDYVWVVRSKK